MTACNTAPFAPDSLTGAIMAIEGVRDAAVLLNGPTGCKFYHGAVSENQMPRADFVDPLYYSEEFYFGQPRVPVTYLDDYDYVFGATEKLEKILPAVAGKGHRLIAVVNSPGAALIGDDLLRFISGADLPVPCVAIENTGFSQPLSRGFQEAVMAMLTCLSPRSLSVGNPDMPPRFAVDGPGSEYRCARGGCSKKRRYVNLLGLSIFHRHWQGDLAELTRLLDACGIGVNVTLCAGCTVSELEHLGAAEVNVVVHEEYARDLVPFLARRFDLETLEFPGGAPVGFDGTASWITTVCEHLGVAPDPALTLIRQARIRAYEALNRFNAFTGLPKGAGFAVAADASLALPLVTWLYEYLGMVPVAVQVDQGSLALTRALQAFLQRTGCGGAWQRDISGASPDVVLGSGSTMARLHLSGTSFTGIEIALPSSGYQHVIPKACMGAQGGLYLIERIINGLGGY